MPLACAWPPADTGPAEAAPASALALLDDPDQWSAFGRPVDGREGVWESYLAVQGMHCATCTLAVEQALQPLPGVLAVAVNGGAATVRIEWRPDTSRPSHWLQALGRAGYDALPAGDLLGAGPRRSAQRRVLWRWMVAGFAMMQAMMYSVPLYLAAPGDISPDAQALLRWGAWMMTLPAVLFSCWPFFTSALRDLAHRRIGMDVPVALGLAIAFAASTAATFDPAGPWGGEVWYDSVTMFVFFLLSGRLLEARLRDRTAGALEALARGLPASVLRLGPEGRFERVALHRLAVGDRVRVLPGEAIPADGCIEAGRTRVDEALLTGESVPLARGPGEAVIAGSHNLAAAIDLRVERVGVDTRHAAIVALMERASVDKPRLARLADRIAGPFLLAVLVAAIGAAAWWWTAGAAHALAIAVAVLVVTCPCALSLATPAATLASAGALARQGILVRQLGALESGAAADTLVFDKTGTLTQDCLGVRAVACRPGVSPAQALAWAAALAAGSLHPAARAVAAAALHPPGGPQAGNPVPQAQDLAEHPGQGVEGQVAGQRLRLGSAVFCDAPADAAEAGDSPQVHLADATGWIARFDLDETLRADAAQTVADLRALGIRVCLLSGDRPAAVARLAQRVGITDWRGACSPQDKLEAVQALQRQGRRVAMVGDGLNDGPVLAAADLSLALGDAVPLAQARADVVVQGVRLAPVVRLLQQARRTRGVVRRNLGWAALYNAASVPLAVLGLMPPWLAGLGMAASSLLVVAHSARLAGPPAEAGSPAGLAAVPRIAH
jgi:Cu2+-exporting ATPase